MDDRSSKIYFGLCILVLVWIGVYWAWEPNEPATPRISISQPQQPTTQPEPKPEPQAPPIKTRQSIEILPTPSAPKLIAPEFKSHTVVQGEVMQSIAKKYYDNPLLWHVIARANPKVDPLKLRQGMTLRIPIDPNNIQGVLQNQNGTTPTNTTPTNQTVEYLVQPGDSLSKIAQNFYGSARHADFIYQSNRNTLRSKDAIRVGQTLKLPPLNEQAP